MNRRRFLRFLGLGSFAAWFVQMPAAVASTLDSCHQALSDIRDVALGPGKPKDRLDAIVAIVDGELGSVAPTIQGDFAGVIPAGETWKVGGDLNLTGDLIVEGTLTGVDTFTVQGNGHQILVQNGGRLDWSGKLKKALVSWGDPIPIGWAVGDLLYVAPTAVGDTEGEQVTWQGDWASTFKPSPSVTLVDGSVREPEVANLSQSVQVNNISRIMFHGSPGVQSLANVVVVDAGLSDVLDFYPIHFHLAGDSVRGSTLTDVVVLDSKFRAFVPHASHGITFTRCVAVRAFDTSFWWNEGDESHDTLYDRCAVLDQPAIPRGSGFRYNAFRLGRGNGNRAVGCVVAGMSGSHLSGPFLWPEADSGVWAFEDCVSHNNWATGLIHYSGSGPIDRFTAYRNQFAGVDQLTYVNSAEIRDVVLSENGLDSGHAIEAKGVKWTALAGGIFENIVTDGGLKIGGAQATAQDFIIATNLTLPDGVTVDSGAADPEDGKLWWRFIDCGLSPADFTMIDDGGPLSIFEVIEGGVEVHRYENGGWV